jgi:hypothetical protein
METPPAGSRGSNVLVVSYFAVVFLLLSLVPSLFPVFVCLPLFLVFAALLLGAGVVFLLPCCIDEDGALLLFFCVDEAACDEA